MRTHANGTANAAANGRRPTQKRRSALGFFLGVQLARYSPRAVLAMALGAELADRIVQAFQLLTLENVTRTCKDGSRAKPEWREVHGDGARHLLHVARFVLLVLERVHVDNGRAASSRLYLGRTRDEKTGAYVPSGHQGGLAARVGVSVKELERYTAVLEHAGIWKVWQPKERDEGGKGCRAPKKLPRKLRGETYAYNHWQLIGPVPRRLRENLARHYRKKSPPNNAPDAAGAARTAAPADAGGLSFAEELLAELKAGKLAARTRDGPPS